MLRMSRLINVGPHISEISRDMVRKRDRDRHIALSSLILVRFTPSFRKNAQNLKGKTAGDTYSTKTDGNFCKIVYHCTTSYNMEHERFGKFQGSFVNKRQTYIL